MMHVVVDDRHAGETASPRMGGGHGDVVEQAEPHRAVPLCVVAGRSDHRKGARTRGSVEHVLDGRDTRARGKARHLVGVWRRVRVRIERRGPPGRLAQQRQVLAVVDTCELVGGRGPRLDDAARALPDLRRHDLHHLRAFDALGMSRGVQMIGKPIGGEDGERHG